MPVVLGGLLLPLVVTLLSLIGWERRRRAATPAPWWPWALAAVALGTALLFAIQSGRPIPSRNGGDLAIKVAPLALWGVAMAPVRRGCLSRGLFVAASLVIAAASYIAVGLVEARIGVPPA